MALRLTSNVLARRHPLRRAPQPPVAGFHIRTLATTTPATLDGDRDDADPSDVRAARPRYGLVRRRAFSTTPHPPSSSSTPPLPPLPSGSSAAAASVVADAAAIVKAEDKAEAKAAKAAAGKAVAVAAPKSLPAKVSEGWQHLKDELKHYWVSTKLLASDVATAKTILSRVLAGSSMTRRERLQLLRTTTDIFRIVPFSLFIIIPFMELLLPFAIKLFPNMLPSTFHTSLKKEETLKKELKMRVSMAGFLQSALAQMATKGKGGGDDDEASASELADFIEDAKRGTVDNAQIMKFAKVFNDDLTLDNIGRSQLVNLCKYMGLVSFGTDTFLRWQLRNKVRGIRNDDQRILWEGMDAMTLFELQEACADRGMRATGLSRAAYARQLKHWIDLSGRQQVPISMLIMSRAFMLDKQEKKEKKKKTPVAAEELEAELEAQQSQALAEVVSSLDDEVVNEAIVEAARGTELQTDEIRERRLESIKYQNHMIEDEHEQKADEEVYIKKKKESKADEEAEAEAEAGAAAAAVVDDGASDVEKKFAVDAAEHLAATMATSAAPPPPPEATAAPRFVVDPRPNKAAAPPKDADDEDCAMRAAAGAEAAAEAAGADGADGDEDVEMTLVQLEALAASTSSSSVESEKAMVAAMKAELAALVADDDADTDTDESAADGATDTPPGVDAAPARDEPAAAAAAADPAAAAAPAEAEPAATAATPEPEPEPDAADADAEAAAAAEAAEAKAAAKAEKKQAAAEDRLRNKLGSMLDSLEEDIEKADATIGDRMQLLDRDSDGILSGAELEAGILEIYAGGKDMPTISQKQAAALTAELLAEMDKDDDGLVTVGELQGWVARRLDLAAGDVTYEEEKLFRPPDEEPPTVCAKEGAGKEEVPP